VDGELSEDLQKEARRAAACLALGIDPATVVWASEAVELAPREPVALDRERVEFSDADWRAIAPLLPPEAPQAHAMTNRDFLDAVLNAMRRGAWVSRQTPAPEIEGVRRRFGRWAHLGVFAALAEALPGLELSQECKRLLALAGERAAQLKSRAVHPRKSAEISVRPSLRRGGAPFSRGGESGSA
jgi:transposase